MCRPSDLTKCHSCSWGVPDVGKWRVTSPSRNWSTTSGSLVKLWLLPTSTLVFPCAPSNIYYVSPIDSILPSWSLPIGGIDRSNGKLWRVSVNPIVFGYHFRVSSPNLYPVRGPTLPLKLITQSGLVSVVVFTFYWLSFFLLKKLNVRELFRPFKSGHFLFIVWMSITNREDLVSTARPPGHPFRTGR